MLTLAHDRVRRRPWSVLATLSVVVAAGCQITLSENDDHDVAHPPADQARSLSGASSTSGAGTCGSGGAPQAPSGACAGGHGCPGIGQECGEDGLCHYPCTKVGDCALVDARFVACEGGFCRSLEELEPECDALHPCAATKDCVANRCR
jgi:hypothetical protein